MKNEHGVYIPIDNGLEVHHIKPVSEGGGDEPENLITLCHDCHMKRHHGEKEKEMIKIIEEGKVPKNQKSIYTIECQYCGCVFECESSDFLDMSRGLDGTFTVLCPCCNIIIENSTNFVEIKYEDIE